MSKASSSRLSPWLTQRWLPGPPLIHFLLLGGLLLALSRWLIPDPLPVLGPPDVGRLSARVADYANTTGRSPTDAVLEEFEQMELRDELLFREALAREWHTRDQVVANRLIQNTQFLYPQTALTAGAAVEKGLALNMHLTDEVIRRRLVQMMEQELLRRVDFAPIDEAVLRSAYSERIASLKTPASISFSHVFLGEIDETQAKDTLRSIRDANHSESDARAMGKPFLNGYTFQGQTWQQVTNRFGDNFSAVLAEQLLAMPKHTGWLEPIVSPFGWHLVFIDDFQPESTQTFEQAVDQLRWQLQQERERDALSAAINALMTNYQVRLL